MDDLQATLLELARTITVETQWRDEGRSIWKENLRNKSLSAERQRRLRASMEHGGRLQVQRADEIRTAASSAPTNVAAILFRAATRLETGERDAPQLLEQAAAELLGGTVEQSAKTKSGADVGAPRKDATKLVLDAWDAGYKSGPQILEQVPSVGGRSRKHKLNNIQQILYRNGRKKRRKSMTQSRPQKPRQGNSAKVRGVK